MRKTIPFVANLILSFVASCGTSAQNFEVEISSTNTVILLSATASPTNTHFPTLIHTETPSPTPPSVAASYNVPTWLGNSENMVIMAITDLNDNSNQLTFFNANTQERYDIPLPISSLSHYFWTTNGESFGLLSRDRTTVFLVNTNTGTTREYLINEEASKCLQEYFDDRGSPENRFILSKMWVYDISPESKTFFCEPHSSFSFPQVKESKESAGFSEPVAWSRDYSYYIAKSSLSENYGLPCIININGSVFKCLNAIDEKYFGSGLDLFRWSKDGNQLYYAQSDATRADLCIYDLTEDKITCPSEKISELNSYNIEYYAMSDDEQFFHVLYGSSCSQCDFWGEPSSFVFRRDGTDILFMGKELQEPNTNWAYPFFSGLFRPSP